MPDQRALSYWKSNLTIVLSLLAVWFFISFACGILFVDFLDSFRFAGFKLGFWVAQQGSIIVFLILVIAYIWLMDRLDAKYNEELATFESSSDGDAE
jgi:putative solute:sodium symporter small subunit